LENYYKWDVMILHLRRNYLAEFLDNMAAVYHDWGMVYDHAVPKLRAAALFGEWLQENRIPIRKIDAHHAKAFLAQYVPKKPRVPDSIRRFNSNNQAGVNMMVKTIHRKYPPKAPPSSLIDKEIKTYTDYLRQKRALADGGVANHVFFVRPFLEAMFGDAPIRPACLTPESVRQYVLSQRQRYQLATVRGGVAGKLRSLFKHWELSGHEMKRLLAAIPKFRVLRRCLPHIIIDEEDYGTLWNAFDRTTATGRRDYAAVRCMADLGIRVGDVAILTLDDIKWRKGEIRVPNSKEGMPLWLPLPKALGEALADYVRHGRPKSSSRIIFLRHIAPRGEPRCTSMIRNAFRRALKRAGLHGKYSGTHTLRHSLATHLRRSKASVKDMADVLGHSALQSTTIYAQIDLPALRAVAQPWPEGGR